MSQQTCTALVVRTKVGQPTLSKEDIPMPSPAPTQAIVKVSYVAQNPTDVQSFDGNAFGDGAILGCDFVGEVVELGGNVRRLSKGDTVAGLIWGGEIKGQGGYSEYCVVDENISFKVPKGISCDNASTVPLAAATAWLALFSSSCLNINRAKAKGASILIWGGSSSVGLYAIQFASLFGLDVVTTCSPNNNDLVRSHGAKYVFDYREDNVIGRIQEATPNLQYTFDTIGNSTSSSMASRALSREGNLCTVRPGKANTENVVSGTHITGVLVWTVFLKDHSYGHFKWPASKDDNELGRELFDKLPAWLENGVIKTNEPKVLQGLDGVPQGFQEYRDGTISGYKIVYKI